MSAYNAISRFSASFNPRNFVTIVTASSGSTNTTDFTSYSNFSSQDDFLTKMNTLYGTHGGGTSSPATDYNTDKFHMSWTTTASDTNGNNFQTALRPQSTLSQEDSILSTYDFQNVVDDWIAKINLAATNTGNLTYEGQTVSPYYVWSNNSNNTLHFNIVNFEKILLRIYFADTTNAVAIFIVFVDKTQQPWGYFKETLQRSSTSSAWTGNFVASTNVISKSTPTSTHNYSFSQWTN